MNFEFSAEGLNEYQQTCLERMLEISAIRKTGEECGINCFGNALYVIGAINKPTYLSSKEAMLHLEKMKRVRKKRFGDLIAFFTKEDDYCLHLGILLENGRNPRIFNWSYYRKPEVLCLNMIFDPAFKERYFRPQINIQ
ncbi:hypothetical protein HZA33_03895 [Candidatus Pacearchaeota archaeon]|nr:hypothetical protein [Candidatus Pacearchaeota archaeon]